MTAPLDLDDARTRLTAAMDKLHDVAHRAATFHVSITDGSPYWPRPRVAAVYQPVDGIPSGRPGVDSGLELIRACSPAAVLARVAADRAILTEVLSWGHDYNDADPYYSCSQASSTWEEDRSPGSGCADDERAGQPCDCGVDARRNVIIGALLDAYQPVPEDLGRYA